MKTIEKTERFFSKHKYARPFHRAMMHAHFSLNQFKLVRSRIRINFKIVQSVSTLHKVLYRRIQSHFHAANHSVTLVQTVVIVMHRDCHHQKKELLSSKKFICTKNKRTEAFWNDGWAAYQHCLKNLS